MRSSKEAAFAICDDLDISDGKLEITDSTVWIVTSVRLEVVARLRELASADTWECGAFLKGVADQLEIEVREAGELP